MEKIERHIAYLLRRHDCVMLPGFGAFVATRQPAHIDRATGTIYPPKRIFSFNAAITHDDGLLSASVARKECISYERAHEIILAEVDSLRHQLNVYGEIAIRHLGTLSIQHGADPIFTPEQSTTDGLCEVSGLKFVISEARREAIISVRPQRRRIAVRRWMSVAATVMLLLVCGFAFTSPIVLSNVQKATMAVPGLRSLNFENIMMSSNDSVNNHPEDIFAEISSDLPSGILSIAIPLDPGHTCVIEHDNTDPEEQESVSGDNNDNEYAVVVASHRTMSEAEIFVASSNDSEKLTIAEQSGRYRVIYATAPTSNDAIQIINHMELRQRYPDAWVCHL